MKIDRIMFDEFSHYTTTLNFHNQSYNTKLSPKIFYEFFTLYNIRWTGSAHGIVTIMSVYVYYNSFFSLYHLYNTKLSPKKIEI